MNLFVSNLHPDTKADGLRTLFSDFGEVLVSKVIFDSATGASRGFGFVEMADRNQSHDAIDNLDMSFFEGNIINVKEAKQSNTGTGTNNSRQGGYNSKPGGGYNNNRSGGGGYGNSRPGGGYNNNNSGSGNRSSSSYSRPQTPRYTNNNSGNYGNRSSNNSNINNNNDDNFNKL